MREDSEKIVTSAVLRVSRLVDPEDSSRSRFSLSPVELQDDAAGRFKNGQGPRRVCLLSIMQHIGGRLTDLIRKGLSLVRE